MHEHEGANYKHAVPWFLSKIADLKKNRTRAESGWPDSVQERGWRGCSPMGSAQSVEEALGLHAGRDPGAGQRAAAACARSLLERGRGRRQGAMQGK